jgi:IS30 family transposase
MTREQRCQIQELLSIGKTQREIAEEIEVNQSSISREIARNSIGYSYDFKISDGISVRRRSSASEIPKRMKGELKTRGLSCLHKDWSPEQISGRLKLERLRISHESIYKHVRADRVAGGSHCEHLRHGGKKYRKRVGKSAGVRCIPNRAEIYFARPYKSCDRGLNEHTNGLIRQYLAKKFDFKNVTDKRIRKIQNLLRFKTRLD